MGVGFEDRTVMASSSLEDDGDGSDTETASDVQTRTVHTDAPGRTPPGPDGIPVVGNTLSFLRDPLAFYDRCARFDADVVTYSIAGDDGYMVRHPDAIERILVSDASKFRRGDLVLDSLGEFAEGGLFLAQGEKWRRERTALQPAFYRDRIESYAEMMTRYAQARADEWAHGETVVATEEMRTLTLEILTKTLLDVDIRGRETTIGRSADILTDHFDASSISSMLPLWVPTPRNRRAKRAMETFDAVIAEMVADRRASDESHDDVLSILLDLELEDGSGLSDQDIRDHLFTFLFAGHETTAVTLSYALFLLANNPEKQAALHDELDEVLGGESATAGDLFELDYLGNVVDEAMRLYPPAYTVFREPVEDVTVRGYEIPEGSVVTLPQWVVHRDGRWFDNPGAFRPERWTDEMRSDLPEYAYFPFGGGPRHCIGMRFALMEAKLVLAALASRFHFRPGTEPPLDLSMQLTLQPEDDIAVEIAER